MSPDVPGDLLSLLWEMISVISAGVWSRQTMFPSESWDCLSSLTTSLSEHTVGWMSRSLVQDGAVAAGQSPDGSSVIKTCSMKPGRAESGLVLRCRKCHCHWCIGLFVFITTGAAAEICQRTVALWMDRAGLCEAEEPGSAWTLRLTPSDCRLLSYIWVFLTSLTSDTCLCWNHSVWHHF